MKKLINATVHAATKLKLPLMAILLGCASTVNAQAVTVPCSQIENVRPGQQCSQTGVIELQELEDYFLTISGTRYAFDYGLSKVFLGGEEVGAAYLDTGMVVRFILDLQATLIKIEILGPFDKIRPLLLKQS